MSLASKHRLAILASGRGTNTRAILNYFQDHPAIEVAVVVSNKPDAGVLDVAQAFGVPQLLITNEAMATGDALVQVQAYQVHAVILAGFLKLLPAEWVAAFPQRIINIHPALLPQYGGKGMYGDRVHRAVSEAGDTTSGITIHFVNEVYDAGAVIAQYTTPIPPGADPAYIAQQVQRLEHRYYPAVIEAVLCDQSLPV